MERVEVVSPVLRFFGDGPQATLSGGPFTSLVHLHGAVFTAWVLLFIAQTVLVASHRVAVHRRGVDPLAFLAIPIFDMVLFATFVTAALVLRRDRETHKRLMLLAYLSIIVAAVARLPGVLPLGPLAFFGLG